MKKVVYLLLVTACSGLHAMENFVRANQLTEIVTSGASSRALEVSRVSLASEALGVPGVSVVPVVPVATSENFLIGRRLYPKGNPKKLAELVKSMTNDNLVTELRALSEAERKELGDLFEKEKIMHERASDKFEYAFYGIALLSDIAYFIAIPLTWTHSCDSDACKAVISSVSVPMVSLLTTFGLVMKHFNRRDLYEKALSKMRPLVDSTTALSSPVLLPHTLL